MVGAELGLATLRESPRRAAGRQPFARRPGRPPPGCSSKSASRGGRGQGRPPAASESRPSSSRASASRPSSMSRWARLSVADRVSGWSRPEGLSVQRHGTLELAAGLLRHAQVIVGLAERVADRCLHRGLSGERFLDARFGGVECRRGGVTPLPRPPSWSLGRAAASTLFWKNSSTARTSALRLLGLRSPRPGR